MPAPKTPPVDVRSDAATVARMAAFFRRQPAESGNRNNALYWAACRCVEAGTHDFSELIEAALLIGLDEAEARRAIASAQRKVPFSCSSTPLDYDAVQPCWRRLPPGTAGEPPGTRGSLRGRWRTEVLIGLGSSVRHAGCYCYEFADDMTDMGYVSVSQTRLADDLGVDQRRIKARIAEAIKAGLLTRCSAGYRGRRRAVYVAQLPSRPSDEAAIRVRIVVTQLSSPFRAEGAGRAEDGKGAGERPPITRARARVTYRGRRSCRRPSDVGVERAARSGNGASMTAWVLGTQPGSQVVGRARATHGGAGADPWRPDSGA